MNMREKTEQKVFSFLEEEHMISPGETVVVGVSGGADSVCLLFLLLEYKKKIDCKLQVVHINHGIREAAVDDAEYVKALCDKERIPFHLTEANVTALAGEAKISEEAAGRQVRYQAFYQVAEKTGAAKIAVAHNKNDNAETVLFHLIRGSGIGGLAGMAPVREGENHTKIIRPLLCLEREEIEAYLTQRGISWQEDITNEGDKYTRNKIRHHILPYAEAEIAEGAVDHIHRSAELLRETEDYLAQQTVAFTEEVLTAPGHIDCEAFSKVPALFQKRILFSLAKELSPTGKDITRIHVKDMFSLFEKTENRTIHLPFGIEVSRRYGEVVLERMAETQKEVFLPQETFTYRIFPKPENIKIPDNRCTKWFDYDKIEQSIQIRTRQEGDYLTIRHSDGEMKHKTLKQYMIDEKIPKQCRDEIPILVQENHVVWVVGYRISEFFKVTENTNTVLEVKLIGNDCADGQ